METDMEMQRDTVLTSAVLLESVPFSHQVTLPHPRQVGLSHRKICCRV